MNNVNVQDRDEFDLRLLTTIDNLRLVANEPRKGCKTVKPMLNILFC